MHIFQSISRTLPGTCLESFLRDASRGSAVAGSWNRGKWESANTPNAPVEARGRVGSGREFTTTSDPTQPSVTQKGSATFPWRSIQSGSRGESRNPEEPVSWGRGAVVGWACQRGCEWDASDYELPLLLLPSFFVVVHFFLLVVRLIKKN